MASRRRQSHGLGSYDRAYDYVERQLAEMRSIESSARANLSSTREALESGSHGRLFKAKAANQDVLAKLSRILEHARTSESTSGSQLDRLPRHSPFEKAHDLMREFRSAIEQGERLRKHLIKVSYGDAETIRAGLETDRDPRRTRVRRVLRRR